MNQTLTIPTSLKDITLSNYVKFLKISESNTDELFINQKMIQIFTGLELSYVDKMASTDFIDIASQLQKVLAETPELINRFTLNNVDYGFIPDFEKLTLGEFIDLDNALGDWSKLSEIMSVLYRPIKESKGNQYTIQSYTGEQQPFENMPLDVVLGSMVFFLEFKQSIVRNYSELFKGSSEGSKNKKDTTGHGQFSIKWGWYVSVFALAGGSFKDIPSTYKQSLYSALYHLAFISDKRKLENQKT